MKRRKKIYICFGGDFTTTAHVPMHMAPLQNTLQNAGIRKLGSMGCSFASSFIPSFLQKCKIIFFFYCMYDQDYMFPKVIKIFYMP